MKTTPATKEPTEIFVASLVGQDPLPMPVEPRVSDLLADLVRSILQQAKKQGAQPYAIAYLLFGAGLLPQEVLRLERSHHICNPRQHLVQINQGLDHRAIATLCATGEGKSGDRTGHSIGSTERQPLKSDSPSRIKG